MTDADFGHYRLGALIGEGGMGRVHLAVDLRLGRQVALKLMPDSMAQSPEMVARFLREARLLATVNHPNVVTVHSVDEFAGQPFFTMEYIEGRTLQDSIRAGGLPLHELVAIALPLAEGLAAAHARGIVHRDLKPANVMRSADGRLKILDFGIAKPDGGLLEGAAPLTRTGAVMGTPAYMAPEQLRGELVGPATDLFSLAVLLYELATGSRPFTASSDAELMSSVLRDAPRPLSERRPDLPSGFVDIVNDCLRKQPAHRPASAGVVIERLRTLEFAGAGASPASETFPRTIASLAVLPLQEIGAGVEELLADGIAEALIANLARSSDLKVISRSSSMRFKDSTEPLHAIASRLGVDALVSGSVRRSGNRVRVSVELVDPGSDRVLWTNRYDRKLEDVLRLQEEISEAIAAGLQASVGTNPLAGAAQKVDPEVYFLDLKGRNLIEQRSEASLRAALDLFRRGLARSPLYGPLLIGVARAYNMLISYGLVDTADARQEIQAALDRARQVNADPAELLGEQAHMRWQLDFDWVGADQDFQRALEHAPGNARLLYWRGIVLATAREFDAAQDSLSRAALLDPLSFHIPAAQGWVCYFARRLDEAEATLRSVIAGSPDAGPPYWLLGMVLEAKGDFGGAVGQYERALHRLGRISRMLGYIGHAYARAGRRADAESMLAELQQRAGSGIHVPRYFIALVHAGLGNVEAALDALEQARQAGDSMLRDLLVDGSFDELREHSRFQALVAILQRFDSPPDPGSGPATRVLGPDASAGTKPVA
jgi:serine/threonine protein kinase/tetratricopeptide (TPR) repeat protein